MDCEVKFHIDARLPANNKNTLPQGQLPDLQTRLKISEQLEQGNQRLQDQLSANLAQPSSSSSPLSSSSTVVSSLYSASSSTSVSSSSPQGISSSEALALFTQNPTRLKYIGSTKKGSSEINRDIPLLCDMMFISENPHAPLQRISLEVLQTYMGVLIECHESKKEALQSYLNVVFTRHTIIRDLKLVTCYRFFLSQPDDLVKLPALLEAQGCNNQQAFGMLKQMISLKPMYVADIVQAAAQIASLPQVDILDQLTHSIYTGVLPVLPPPPLPKLPPAEAQALASFTTETPSSYNLLRYQGLTINDTDDARHENIEFFMKFYTTAGPIKDVWLYGTKDHGIEVQIDFENSKHEAVVTYLNLDSPRMVTSQVNSFRVTLVNPEHLDKILILLKTQKCQDKDQRAFNIFSWLLEEKQWTEIPQSGVVISLKTMQKIQPSE